VQHLIAPCGISIAKTHLLGYISNVNSLSRLFQFPNSSFTSESAKLQWLVKLRWLAILLFFLLALPGYLTGTLSRESITIYIGLVSFLFIFNLLTQLIFTESQKTISPLFICFQLTFDLLILTSLLLIADGFKNPFIALFLLNASLGAILIRGKYSWPFIMLCHALLTLLQLHFLSIHLDAKSQITYSYFFASHILIFSVWFVMRSLGVFLENHFEKISQEKIKFEKQDRLRALGALAAGFSHEFASPLNAAKIHLERLERILKDQNNSSQLLENIADAKMSIHECEHVVQTMNSSQIDIRAYHPKVINVADFLNDVLDSWKEVNQTAQVHVFIKSTSPLSVSPINFAQVILNLLDNAFQANPQGKISIIFEIHKSQVKFCVQDDGPGFSQFVLERKGEPFVTTKKNGTGLGLYVSEIFAQSMGGNLKIKNNTPNGATVTLTWPHESH